MSCHQQQWVIVGAIAAGLAMASCESTHMPLPPCESGQSRLVVRTADGATTIAAVTTLGGCRVSNCMPSTATPCAEVTFLSSSGPCDLTFVSVDGRSVSLTPSTVAGEAMECRDGTGQVLSVRYSSFQPSTIDIDFSIAPPTDGGTD